MRPTDEPPTEGTTTNAPTLDLHNCDFEAEVSSITKLRLSTFKMIETLVMVVTFGYTGAERNFS